MTTMFDDLMNGLNEVDAFLAGEKKGFKVTVPAEVDVKEIRTKLHMTQARFSDTFGFSLDTVKHWEGGRRTPETPARAFLTVIARNPAAVIEALQPQARAASFMQSPVKRTKTAKSDRVAAAKPKAARRVSA